MAVQLQHGEKIDIGIPVFDGNTKTFAAKLTTISLLFVLLLWLKLMKLFFVKLILMRADKSM